MERGVVVLLLAIDVGNTHIMTGVFEKDKLIVCWRISTQWEKTEDELGIMIKNLFYHSNLSASNISAMVISSVVPPLRYSLEKMGHKYFHLNPLMVTPQIKTGISIDIDDPKEVGADRIVNAVAGYYCYGGPIIIVDFGTATTYCAISKKGVYLGGAIAPGVGISTEALFDKAAKLPRVEMAKPPSIIGKNTITGLQSGILYGFVGQVDGIVNRMMEHFSQRPTVVATGGLAWLISSESETIDVVNKLLTLEGLRIIYHKNCVTT